LPATFIDQKFDDRVPQGGRLVRAFFGGKAAERLMRCGNDETAAVARMELARDSGSAAGAASDGCSAMAAQPSAVCSGASGTHEGVDERVRRSMGLWLLGNGYRGVGLPDLVRDARSAARQIAKQETPVCRSVKVAFVKI
jgi:oxygen-dependent protoporphyrinogen oxidase